MKKIFLTLMILAAAVTCLGADAPDQKTRADSESYVVLKLDGGVNPVVADYLVEGIKRASKEGARFVVLQMDTPGGLMTSMRDIIKAIFTSEIPVVVFTYPKGAQAASAGGFIMLSAHVAVMSPGTEIGAMHPVSPQLDFLKKDKDGSPAGVMEKKVLNDTVAYARSLAQKRKRNIKWTERAVREAISSTYTEALRLRIIDLVAEDMPDLLKKLNNRRVNVNGKVVTMKTRGLKEVVYNMTWKEELVNKFADPQVIFLLFIIAVVGIGMEFKNPGMIVPGTIGAVSLFIFLMAIQVIPINAMGLLLIIAAVILFILELQIVSYGLLTLGGIVAFVLGSMLLFDSPLPGGHIPISSIIAAVLFVLAFVFLVVRLVFNAHRGQVSTGSEGMINNDGIVLKDFIGKGKIMIHGEIWNAVSEDSLLKGEEVIVTEVKGMDLVVKKKETS